MPPDSPWRSGDDGAMVANSPPSTIGGARRANEGIDDSRVHVIIVESLYLCILLAVAGLCVTGNLSIPKLIVAFPAGVLWFGALGAVLISLTGAVEHRLDWDPSWASWHYTRPLVGASLALVSWLIFQAGILAVGSPVPGQAGARGGAPTDVTAPTNILFYLIAFVVGYREETFREMIKRVADVILTSKTPAATPAKLLITRVTPSTGKAAGGDAVEILGSGFTEAAGVKFGDSPAASVRVDNDGQITATTPQGSVGTVRVTVTSKDGSAAASSEFTYT